MRWQEKSGTLKSDIRISRRFCSLNWFLSLVCLFNVYIIAPKNHSLCGLQIRPSSYNSNIVSSPDDAIRRWCEAMKRGKYCSRSHDHHLFVHLFRLIIRRATIKASRAGFEPRASLAWGHGKLKEIYSRIYGNYPHAWHTDCLLWGRKKLLNLQVNFRTKSNYSSHRQFTNLLLWPMDSKQLSLNTLTDDVLVSPVWLGDM